MKVIRKYPLYLHALIQLEAYLPPGHRKLKAVQDEIYRQHAGYSGEKRVDREIRKTRLIGPARVFTDLQFKNGPDPADVIQIDTLILTAKGIWILEAKRYRGKLRYQENPRRLERIEKDGTLTTFDCPILQLETQIRAVEDWLAERQIQLPVAGKVAFVSSNTWEGLPADAPIIPVKQIPAYLEGEHSKWGEVITPLLFNEIAMALEQERGRFFPFPLCLRFDIDPNELKRGILCPGCNGRTDRISERRDRCPACRTVQAPDYGQLILNWLLLIHPTISNLQFRRFTGIKNRQTVSRIFAEFELDQRGSSVTTCFTVNLLTGLDGIKLKKRKAKTLTQ